MNPIEKAIRDNKLNQLRLLLDLGYDPNRKIKDGGTLLHLAASVEVSKGTIQVLLDYGADINARDIFGVTPLQVAVICDRKNTACYLLELGADINLCSGNNNNLLFEAVKFDCVSMVDLLCKHGADINTRDQNGKTLLHNAVQSNTLEKVEFFIKLGADINAKDYCGKTPLFEAIEHSDNRIITALINSGGRFDRFIETAAICSPLS